jgi:glutathione S-transferase
MKLHYSPSSPFVRKVMVSAIELGLDGEIEKVTAAVNPINRNAAVIADNPLGQVPTLIGREGKAIHDSRVICEYLDHCAGGHRLFPAPGPARWQALTEQSLADGMLDAAIIVRYEATLRPEPLRWAEWDKGQRDKIMKGLDAMERTAAGFGVRVDIGTIAAGCALGYLDFRFADIGWRNGRPMLTAWFDRFAARPSMTATAPKG